MREGEREREGGRERERERARERERERERELSSLCVMRECLVCRTVITLPTIIFTSSLQNRQRREDRLADRRTTH